MDPWQKLSHIGVDPRVVGFSTALAPAHDAHQAPRKFILANEGAPAVTLQHKARTKEAALPPGSWGAHQAGFSHMALFIS